MLLLCFLSGNVGLEDLLGGEEEGFNDLLSNEGEAGEEAGELAVGLN